MCTTSHQICIPEQKEGNVISAWKNHTLHTCNMCFALLTKFMAMKITVTLSSRLHTQQPPDFILLCNSYRAEFFYEQNALHLYCVKQSTAFALWSKACLKIICLKDFSTYLVYLYNFYKLLNVSFHSVTQIF